MFLNSLIWQHIYQEDCLLGPFLGIPSISNCKSFSYKHYITLFISANAIYFSGLSSLVVMHPRCIPVSAPPPRRSCSGGSRASLSTSPRATSRRRLLPARHGLLRPLLLCVRSLLYHAPFFRCHPSPLLARSLLCRLGDQTIL